MPKGVFVAVADVTGTCVSSLYAPIIVWSQLLYYQVLSFIASVFSCVLVNELYKCS